MEHCIQSANILSPCLMCGGRAEKMHRPMFHRGSFCARCCPVCSRTASAEPAAVRTVIGFVPRPATQAAQGATQWKDGGWGPRLNDPWYHDRERHESRRPWVPPRANWFK